jgi:plastocyanin
MDRTKLWVVVAVVVFVLTTVIFLQNPASADAAQQCFPVKVWDRDKIEPLSLSVNKGDCVVWINFTQPVAATAGDVLIVFPDAKECGIKEVKASTGFKMEEALNCFIGGWLRPGETASLVFEKPGTYKYKVQFRSGKVLKDALKGGTIVVK